MSRKGEGAPKASPMMDEIEAVVRRVLAEKVKGGDGGGPTSLGYKNKLQLAQAQEDEEVSKLVERGLRKQREKLGLLEAQETRAAELQALRTVGREEIHLAIDPATEGEVTAIVHLPGLSAEDSDEERGFSGTPLTVRAKKRFLRAFRAKGIIEEGLYAGQATRAVLRNWCKNDPVFAEYFMDAQETAGDRMEAELWDRAMNGVEIRKYNKEGALVDVYYQKSDLLLMFMLKGMRPAKYKERLESADQKSTVDAIMGELRRLGAIDVEAKTVEGQK